jgi:hypothetical protein
MAVMVAAPGSWLADELADGELAAGELAAEDVTGPEAAAFTVPLEWGFALPARKATDPTAASTTTAATAISQTRLDERRRLAGPLG